MPSRRFGTLRTDHCRRRLVAQSRHAGTPEKCFYEWNLKTADFTAIQAPEQVRFQDNWTAVEQILKERRECASHHELLIEWPAEEPRPTPGVLYDWLKRAHAEKLVRRQGTGHRTNPYRFRLPTFEDEYYDRGDCRRCGR